MQQHNIQTAHRSFKIDLEELHCTIYFIFLNGKTLGAKVDNAIDRLRSLHFIQSDNENDTRDLIEPIFEDCEDNPGFTFQLNDTNVFIGLQEHLLDDSFEYKIGIICHEIYHAIAFIFNALGLDISDDEHIAIITGNIVEKMLQKVVKK